MDDDSTRPARSSRGLFGRYREQFKARQQGDLSDEDRDPLMPMRRSRSRARARSALTLGRAFYTLLHGHRLYLGLALATLTVSTLVALAPLYAPKIVFDSVLGDDPLHPWLVPLLPARDHPKLLLLAVCAGSIVLIAITVGVGLWGRWQATRISKRVSVDVKRDAFEHAAHLPLHRVYELKTGGVTSILRQDAGEAGNLVFSLIYNPWKAIVQLSGTLAILAVVDWRLLLGACSILPIVWYTHKTWISRIRPMWRDVRTTRSFVDAHATEAFGGMRVVRGFGRQKTESATFTRRNNLMARQELWTWWWMRGIDAAWQLIIPLATAILLMYGGIRILDDRAAVAAGTLAEGDALSIGDLVMFLGYLTALLSPIAMLAGSATGLQNALAGLDRVLDLLDEPREMPAPPDAVQLPRHAVHGDIVVRDVTYTYPSADDPALRGVSFEVEAGQTVALVGPSGAGKTTLCNLVARFYDPDEGSITLDGHDLRQIDVRSYRTLLGIVEQDIFLFDGSVADNIGYARRDATRDKVVEAAVAANADEFIAALPKGYDTLIGERGVKLSGGQRQRLAIARALLADPKVLILDEATSNLDTHSERLIQGSLRALMADRTSFVIAHRLSTIAHADLILVIDRGQIVDRGTHAELSTRPGPYAGMLQAQLEPAEEPDPFAPAAV